MQTDNYKLFCYQCEEVVKEFPNFSINETNNIKYLKGILDISNNSQIIVGNYLIEIHFTEKFPFRFPKLFEIGHSIPNEPDWHKYSDGSCCLTVLPDEILKCKAGINLTFFIKKYCVSYFANHIYRKENGFYLNGEYSHGVQGLKEFYSDLLKTSDPNDWINYFEYTFLTTKIKYERNNICFCNSGLKFKHCHLNIFDSLRDIGKNQCLMDFRRIYYFKISYN